MLLLWELPQNLVGLGYLAWMKHKGFILSRELAQSRMFVKVKAGAGAVSLGYFIVWSDEGNACFTLDERNKKHEYGHSIQSRMLGPLYLLVVGLPSVSRVFYARWYYAKHGKEWKGYYDGFPENWADRLGKVRSH